MKKLILYLTLGALLPVRLIADPSIKELVEQHIELLMHPEKLGAQPGTTVPGGADFASISKRIFLQYPISHIVCTSAPENGKKTVTDIYVKGEEVYIAQANTGWNLVANGSGVFEWEAGKKTGIKMVRSNADIAAYVEYLIDPAGIMSGTYLSYLAAPDSFTVKNDKENGWTELRPNKMLSPDLDVTIYVSEKPLWLHRSKIKNAGATGIYTVTEPVEEKALPAGFLQSFKAVRFSDSPLTLKRHLVFL